MATAKRRRKTINIPDSQRGTDRITLRLDPELAARLRGIAHVWDVTIGEVIAEALDALERRKQS